MVLIALIATGCKEHGAPPASTPEPSPTGGYVAGVVVLADAPENQNAGIQVFLAGTSYSARTDAKGHYVVSGIPRGTYTVMAEKPGYQSATIGKADVFPDVHTNEKPLTMTTEILEHSTQDTTSGTAARKGFGTVIGQVRLQGAPSNDGVRVAIDGTAYKTVTDDVGTYQFPNVDMGAYSVTFSKHGYAPRSASVNLREGDIAEVPDVVMEREGPTPTPVPPAPPSVGSEASPNIAKDGLVGSRIIQGGVELYDATGARSSDFSRVIVAIDDSDIVTEPNEQGRFQFSGLSPGIYRVLATLDNGAPIMQVVDLSTAQAVEVNLRLGGPNAEGETTGTGGVVGHVVLLGQDNQPADDSGGVRIALLGTQFVATSNHDGSFKIDDIPAGDYSLQASMEGYEPMRQSGLAIQGGKGIDLGEIVLEPKRDYPRVLSTTPVNYSTDVPVTMEIPITVKFSKPMNNEAVKKAISIVPPANYRTLMGRRQEVAGNDATLVILFTNTDERLPIRFDTNYQITIDKSACDLEGLGMRENYTFGFTTGKPGIVRTIPADGDRAAYVNQADQPIMIVFNTRIQRESLRWQAFRFRPSYDQVIGTIDITNDARTGWSTVFLRCPLRYDTEYAITVMPSIRAYNGQRLWNVPYTFRFRTTFPVQLQSQTQVIH